jgi:putative inorganic carbon (hco3(-)) transporter
MNSLNIGAWAAALFLATVLFSHTVAMRLLLLLVAMGCAVAAVVQDRSMRIAPPVWLPFAAWALWAGLSIAWSIEPERSIKEFRNEICYGAAALWVCYVSAQAGQAVYAFPRVLGAGALLICALALHQFVQAPLTSDAWHGGPGNMSSTVLVLMPCAVLAGAYGRTAGWPRRLQWPAWLLVVLLFAAAYTTLNRTVWVALAAQFSMIILMWGLRFREASNGRTKAIGACVAVAVILSGGAMSMHIHAERFGTSVAQEMQRDPRPAIWHAALVKAADQPLLGYGFGRGLLREELREQVDMRVAWHSHNLFIDMALQLGIPGVALLLALIGSTLWHGWRLARSLDPAAAACGIAIMAVAAGMVIRNVTDALWVRQNALLYWGLVGVLLAWGEVRARRS